MYSNESSADAFSMPALQSQSQSQQSQSDQSQQSQSENVIKNENDYDFLSQPKEELSHFPATIETLQNELIEVKRVVTVFGNYLKKVEHVLSFHNDHIKRLVMKETEDIAKQAGAELYPKVPEQVGISDPEKVIKEFSHPIKELTEENMSPKETTILMLYTHTCPHCVTLKPIYEKISPTLIENGINVAAINVARQRKAAIEYQVKGVPSIRLIHKGTKHEYKGKRTESDIIEWVKSIVL
jgi:thiol-disulfide isomerase/thioredoxin